MSSLAIPILGTVNGPSGIAGSGGTAQLLVIPPYPGRGGAVVKTRSDRNKSAGPGITHITSVVYTTGGTAHAIKIARPFNFTWLTTAIAANGTALRPKHDPGLYSTSYNYPIPGGKPAKVANNAIAASDYVVIQLDDGSWHLSGISSGTFGGVNLTLTTALPNNAVGAAVGNPVYFYGDVATDAHPVTGQVNPGTSIAASTARGTWQDTIAGILSSFHPGDPLIAYTPQTTNAGTFDSISGFYADI